MSTFFLIVILLFGFLITFQIAKASEYVGVLKGEKKNFEQNNKVNGFLMIAFLVLAYFLFHSLFGQPPDLLPSALIDKPAKPPA